MTNRELTLGDLRRANLARLPQFKNAHGAPAHAVADGSDWDRAAWLEAMVGEVGEYANFSKKFRRGDITRAEFERHARREIADIQTYLDLLAHALGFNLAKCLEEKFNEVSARVGSDVYLTAELGAHRKIVQDSAYNHVPLTSSD